MDGTDTTTNWPIMCLSDVQRTAVNWLWCRYLAKSKLHCFFGGGGLGKTMIAIELAAVVTTGRIWPDGSLGCPAGAVVYITAEDDVGDTIRPRFEAAGGDSSKFFVLDSEALTNGTAMHFNLSDPDCMYRCEVALRAIPDLQLFIIDPVTAFLGRADSHKIGDVRSALLPLTEMAERLSIAVMFIHHINKSQAQRAVHRASGSTAFIDAVRIAFMVDGDPSDPEEGYVFQVVKSNIEEKPTGIAYRIHAVPEHHTARVEWKAREEEGEPVEGIVPAPPIARPTREKQSVVFIRNALSYGERPATEEIEEGEAAGFSKKEIRTAREYLGINPKKVGFGKDGRYFWGLHDAR